MTQCEDVVAWADAEGNLHDGDPPNGFVEQDKRWYPRGDGRLGSESIDGVDHGDTPAQQSVASKSWAAIYEPREVPKAKKPWYKDFRGFVPLLIFVLLLAWMGSRADGDDPPPTLRLKDHVEVSLAVCTNEGATGFVQNNWSDVAVDATVWVHHFDSAGEESLDTAFIYNVQPGAVAEWRSESHVANPVQCNATVGSVREAE